MYRLGYGVYTIYGKIFMLYVCLQALMNLGYMHTPYKLFECSCTSWLEEKVHISFKKNSPVEFSGYGPGESVLLHPKHDYFDCFSCFSLLVTSWTIKRLVILRCVTSSALVIITYPYARTYFHPKQPVQSTEWILQNKIRVNNNE